MAAQGRQAARQCRSVQFEAGGPGGAQPHGARLRARPDQADAATCCRCSAGTRRPPARAGARRNGRRGAAGCSWCRAIRRSATACRSARCPMCRRRSIPISCRSIRRCRAAPLPARAEILAEPAAADGSRFAARPGRGLLHRRSGAAGPRRAGAWRDRRRGAHRHLRRAARRPAVRLHAAGRGAGGLSRAGRRGREARRRKIGLPVHIEGYGAAARSAPQRHPRRARSRRHRGQHPSGVELGRIASRPRRRSTRRRGSRGSAPTSS